MAIEVTENWSARRLFFDWDVTKWRASRTLCVAYANDELDAINAASAGAPGIYPMAIGTTHPLSAFMVCQSVETDRSQGLNVTLVKGEYTFPSATIILDPLMQPPEIEWQPSLTSAELEYDVGGAAIVTAAGQPFDPPSMTDIGTRCLIVSRCLPFYDADYAGTIENTVNLDAFQINGVGFNTSLRPGTCRLKTMAPVGKLTPITPFPKIRWTFEVRGGYSTDINGFSDAWDVRRVNKGTMGYRKAIATDPPDPADPLNNRSVMDYFYRQSGTPDTSIGPVKVTEPVYLDLEGKPFEKSVGLGYKLYPAVANPNLITGNSLLRYEKLPSPGVNGGFIYILHWPKFRAIPYTGLI